MRAMILAAGRGERMRPLTDETPKPLLEVGGKSLITWQVHRLVAAGMTEIVINHAWLGSAIEASLGDGTNLGARIRYSAEESALETAGGVKAALEMLGDEPFVVTSADVYCDFDYARLAEVARSIGSQYPRHAAHLVLTANPPYHPLGDMGLVEGRITRARPHWTYANIAVFHPAVFGELAAGTRRALFPWLYRWVDAGVVSGEMFNGVWHNVGTPDELRALDSELLAARQAASARSTPAA